MRLFKVQLWKPRRKHKKPSNWRILIFFFWGILRVLYRMNSRREIRLNFVGRPKSFRCWIFFAYFPHSAFPHQFVIQYFSQIIVKLWIGFFLNILNSFPWLGVFFSQFLPSLKYRPLFFRLSTLALESIYQAKHCLKTKRLSKQLAQSRHQCVKLLYVHFPGKIRPCISS